MWRPRFYLVCVFLSGLVGLSAGCSKAPSSPPPHTAEAPAAPPTSPELRTEEWDRHVDAALDGYLEAHPAFAVVLGRHELDGRLPDWSRAGIEREVARLRQLRAQTAAFEDERLDDSRRFERAYLLSRIDRDLFWLDTAKWPFRSPSFYFDWMLDSLDPNVYVSKEYAPLEARLAAYIKYARALPAATEQIKDNLEGPMPRTFVDYGVATFGGLADFFESDVKQVFAPVKDQALQAEFQTENERAIAAMRGLAAFLEGKKDSATDDFALGEETLVAMLRMTEALDLDLEAVEAAGQADLARNTTALERACAELTPGKPITKCVAKVAANKPEGGAVQGARAQLDGLKTFLVEHELITIPGTETAKVEEAPPHKRQNSAYIDTPGPYERGLPSIYYIAPPDPSWSKAEREAYIPGKADLLFTSVHEVWPGHFLQFLVSNRVPSRLGRSFQTYAFVEGWAHYTEEMMWEAGLGAGDAEVHVGQLLNALLRNVRLLSAIGLHSGKMTVEESETMFRERAFTDPGNARQQAARGTYDPSYLSYTLGKLMIRKLREDWTATRGGRDAWRPFHDTVLSYGGPPLPLLRAAMLGDHSGAPL